MVRRHKTKWAVCTSIKNNGVAYFTHLEDAKAFAYEYGYAIYPPIYA